MRYIDLFAGAGGGSLGIKRALAKVGGLAHCQGRFEINKDACRILQKHYPHTPNYGPVENQDWSEWKGAVDLIIAGSPCTELSIIRNAGNTKAVREGLQGKDSKLFYEFVKAIEMIQPKYFLLENVSSMSKEARDEISKILGVEPVEINSSLVSAQNRSRLYWCNWDVPQPKDQFIQLMDIKIRDPFKYAYSWSKSTRKHPNGVILNGHSTHVTKSITRSYDERFRQDQKANCLTGSINGSEAMTFFSTQRITGLPRKVYTRHELLPYNLEPGTWRKLLPVECERLQTFPDGWCRGVSNTAAYRLMGKAMTVSVIEHIMSHCPGVKNA